MSSRHRLCFASICCAAALLSGCASPLATGGLVAGSTTLASMAPTSNVGQTYYLGMFDPREQLPPTIYRIRVQGQSSPLNSTQFASGWVQANLVDSLSGQILLAKNGEAKLGAADSLNGGSLKADKAGALDRRLVLFGPEGFREAPRNHRLVIAMGASPAAFFSAVDQALGIVAQVTQPATGVAGATKPLWADLARMQQEERGLDTLIDMARQP